MRGGETADPAHGVRSRVPTVSRTVGRIPAAHAHVCRIGMMLWCWHQQHPLLSTKKFNAHDS